MAWYDDKKKTTHVARYKDAAAAQREGSEAAATGWMVGETTIAPERVAVGKAITKGLFTVGAGLLRGRPRKGGKVTVRYVRTAGEPTERSG
jgi:hypothetical protein